MKSDKKSFQGNLRSYFLSDKEITNRNDLLRKKRFTRNLYLVTAICWGLDPIYKVCSGYKLKFNDFILVGLAILYAGLVLAKNKEIGGIKKEIEKEKKTEIII